MSRNQTPMSSPRMVPRRVSSNRKISVNVHSPPPTPTLSLSPTFAASPPERASSRLSTGSCASNSTASSASSQSARSSLSQGELQRRRRGFMKPHPTEFSNSARARESVMCLGSIAHLQYFFAKTGLLDGKGGTLMRKKPTGSGANSPTGLTSPFLTVDFSGIDDSTYSSMRSSPELILSPTDDEFFTHSPIDDYESDDDIDDPMMKLPPTTSTYKQKAINLPPTPDPELLRGQLREALAITKRAWEASPLLDGEEQKAPEEQLPAAVSNLQGSELIELATSAIRAAKAYYYTTDITHAAGRNDRAIRDDFLTVLDSLKKMAQSRPFDGRVTQAEKTSVVGWISSVEAILSSEEAQIAEMRKKAREWAARDWRGREMERNHRFLSFFDPAGPTSLPAPASPDLSAPLDPVNPDPFLFALKDGLKLIQIHNSIVRRSKRPFGRIPRFHTDFSKPYRPAENLRYWRKAAEIRWEVNLGDKFDVMEIVNGSQEGWERLRADVNAWCEKVLKEVRETWAEEE